MKVRCFRLMINCFPPYWGTGIRVSQLSDDYRVLPVDMPLHWYSRNDVGRQSVQTDRPVTLYFRRKQKRDAP